MIISKSFFKKNLKQTWKVSNNTTKNAVDYSNHRLIRARITENTKLERLKIIKKLRTLKVNIDKLKK